MSEERLDSAAAEPGSTSRRAVLAGAGAVGATAVLAACGTDSDDGRDPFEPAPPVNDPGANGGEATGEDGPLVEAGEVEVGGGVILADQGVVVTQPAEGEWKGFSATCTHEGCIVTDIAEGTINCACHGSRFSIEDGSVVQAAQGLTPEQQASLPEVEIRAEDGAIFRA